MKKIISLLLVLLFTLSALFLVACDEVDVNDTAKGTNSVETTAAPQKAETTAEPQEPVPVADLNGKTAKQLIEKFIPEYRDAKSFDMAFYMSETVDGETAETNIAFKVTETELWVDMTMDGETIKLWYVDGVAYVDSSDGKFKTSEISSDELLGEGFFENIMSSLPSEMDDAWSAKLDKAQLYYYKNAYYLTIEVTQTEAIQHGEEFGYTEKIYFDTDGNLRKIEMEYDQNKMIMVINSYGKPINIDPPANASEFQDADNSDVQS